MSARLIAFIVGALIVGGFVWLLLWAQAQETSWTRAVLDLAMSVVVCATVVCGVLLLMYGINGEVSR